MTGRIQKRLALVLLALASSALAADDEQFAELDELFEVARLDLKAPALVYGVVAGNDLVHTGQFGSLDIDQTRPAAGDSVFRIASMTKMMTALLVLDLQDQGKLYLDAPAENYAPALTAIKYPTTDSRKITVRDLLNHTAGFVTDNPWADRQLHRTHDELTAFLQQAAVLSYAPGETFDYSNLGWAVLGRIIENVSGQSFSGRLDTRLLQPLGMSDTTLDADKVAADRRAGAYNWVDGVHLLEPELASGSFDPLGGIWTTVNDYARFVGWFISAWPARDDVDEGPIPRRVVRSVTDGVFLLGAGGGGGLTAGDDCQMAAAYSMGLGIRLHCDGGLILTHGGGFPGFGSYVLMMPQKGLGLFAFSNRTYGAVSGPVWDASRLVQNSELARPADTPVADPHLLAAYEGVQNAYAQGDIQAEGLIVADNFFPDRSAERWNRQLAAMMIESGECETAELEASGRYAGDFRWQCENAQVAGRLYMSPVLAEELQYLHLRIVRRDGSGRDLVTDFNFH